MGHVGNIESSIDGFGCITAHLLVQAVAILEWSCCKCMPTLPTRGVN